MITAQTPAPDANVPTPAPGNLPVPQFFVDHKKGEVNELRLLLRAVSLERD